MSASSVLRFLRTQPFVVVLILVVLAVVRKALPPALDPYENFAGQGPDDIMRLLLVRDWLAGQGWYDVVQYRTLPPDGVSLHWSRYIDLGIAAILVPLSWFMSMQTAEVLAAIIWPTVVMIVNLLVIGFGTRRLFGAHAACFALVCTALWPVTSLIHASPGSLDHHNVQMLTMTVMAFALIWPNRPIAAGCIGGLSAAFSLAIGLESLPFVISIGAAVLLRAVFEATPMVHRLLVTFCLALGGGCLVFWMGQAAPGTRMLPVCDELGTPTIALVWIAVLASLSPLAMGARVNGPILHLFATTALTALGIVILWSLISPCLDGPYANLPLELQTHISQDIYEAQSGVTVAQMRPSVFIVMVLPIIVATLSGLALLTISRRAKPRAETTALVGLLFLSIINFAMVFVQMRTVTMAASVLPMLAGYVLAQLWEGYLARRDLGWGLAMLVVAVAVLYPQKVAIAVHPLMPQKGDRSSIALSSECRSYAALTALNEAPAGLILSTGALGPSLLWASHHEALSGNYHRSAASLANGFAPFAMDEPEMQAYVKASGATYLLLCRDFNYDGSAARELASGGTVDWLRPIPLSHADPLLFEVLR